jgi:hypothetical protein
MVLVALGGVLTAETGALGWPPPLAGTGASVRMSIYSIWESRFPAEAAEDGIRVTEAIWRDMLTFDGYQAYELICDLDQPGHLIVVSRWATVRVLKRR